MDDAQDAAKKFLFLCGVPRSGTTAMANLLNSHPKIAIGIERFKNVPRREITRDLFTKERFFDFRPSDTNVQQPRTYERLSCKFDSATLIGDKVPRYYTFYDDLFSRFDDCVIIYMLRQISAVALSWNARAQDSKDTAWPETNDYKRAVDEWNSSIETTRAAKEKYKNRLLIVEYERLFSGDILVLQRLLRKIGLTLSPEMRKYYLATTNNWRPNSDRLPLNGQDAYLAEHANLSAFAQLRKLAIPGVQQATSVL
jgi:hypothetical protein